MVPEGRRHATRDVQTIGKAALRPVSLVCGAGGDRAPSRAGPLHAGGRSPDRARGVDDLSGVAPQRRHPQRRPGVSRDNTQHARLKIDAGVEVYFCDPHSPWQRGTNENTNGLLRQYFPKGTDLSMHSAEEVAAVAAVLNARPRKTLDWKTPAEALDQLLLSANKDCVATTA